MISCPLASRLRSRIDGLLATPEAHPDLAAHVEACADCQAQVEALLDEGGAAPVNRGVPLPHVPGYEVLGRLGRGGMGVVYKARHRTLNRLVALKMIRADSPSPEQRRRFHAEAQAVARLAHPNIVQIHEVGECDGRPYLALELVEGGTLADHLGHKPLPPRDAAAMLATLARAVQAAHAAGVVHRDLKPANILLQHDRTTKHTKHTKEDNEDGDEDSSSFREFRVFRGSLLLPKVTDFGLAKQLDDSTSPTQTGQVMGTPEYMAPEQAAGKPDEVGPLADVWALGAILYECLTGRPPFSGASPLDTLRQVLSDEPAAPSAVQRRIPRDLETVCLKCLHKEPARRYATAGELADDLDRFLAGLPVMARRTGWPLRAWRACRRNPVVATLGGVVLLLLTLTAVGGVVLSLSLDAALDVAREAGRDGQRKLIEAYLSEADAIRMSRRPGQRFVALDRVRDAMALAGEVGMSDATRLRARNVAIAALCLPDLQPGREWGADGAPPDWLDAASRRRERARAAIKTVPPPAFELRGLTWASPDGRFVAVATRNYVRTPVVSARVWRIDGPEPALVLDGIDDVCEEATAFSPDSRQVAFGHFDGTVTVYDLATARVEKRLAKGAGPVYCLAFSPCGSRLAVATDTEVTVWDVSANARLARLPHPIVATAVAWHPQGHRLLTACNDTNELFLWDAATGRAITGAWRGHRNGGIQMRFHPSGDRVVSNDWHDVVRLWDAASGDQLLSIPSTALPEFSPDGGSLPLDRTGDPKAELRVASGEEFRKLQRRTPAGPEECHRIRLHPNGRLVALLGRAGIALLDLRSGEELAFLPGEFGRSTRFDATGALWTSSEAGLLRWPAKAAAEALRIGPPEWVAAVLPDGEFGFDLSEDGRIAVLPLYHSGALVVHQGTPSRTLRLGPQADVRHAVVSPHRRWILTKTHDIPHPGVRFTMWEAETGRSITRLPYPDIDGVEGFSPDGRSLHTVGKRGGRLDLASVLAAPLLADGPATAAPPWPEGWRTERMRPGGVRSPDGRLIAFGLADGGIQLVLAESEDTTLALLQSPETGKLKPHAFTPDGTRLLAHSDDTQASYAFDLRRLREQLAALGLDWDLPPYPAATPEAPGLRVEILDGECGGSRATMAAYESRRARDRLGQDPKDADAHFRLGARLLEAGKAEEAYRHLTTALTLRPDLDEALVPSARCAVRLNRGADADRWASAYLAKCPFDRYARDVRAQARVMQKRYADAAADYSVLLQTYSRNVDFYTRRAACYDALGNPDLARADRASAAKAAGLPTAGR